MESARVNSLTWSGQAEKWAQYGIGTKIDGTLTVDQQTLARRVTEDTSTGAHAISQTFGVSITSATTYSHYSRLRAGTRTSAQVMLTDGSTTDYCYATFDLNTGQVTATYAGKGAWKLGNAVCVPLSAGWFECRITGLVTSATVIRGTTYMDRAGAHSYPGDGTSWLLHGGSQLESGTPTSYIPTTSVATSRYSDFLSTSDLSFLDQENGTLVFDGSFHGVSGGGMFAFSLDDGTDNGIGLYKVNGSGALTAYCGSPGGTGLGVTLADGQRFRAGIAWSAGGASASASANGQKAVTVAGAKAVPAKTLSIASARNHQFASNVLARSLAYWPRRLSDAEPAAATVLT
ncbi:phage head spike fiber domain-containing protein [Paraburkholderia sacchari]|uniref:phage head spike fiber domain-containing protein n=1 Tax=Paraburkholderia sacchari TaxID=159450 RepID=UPI003B8A8B56